MTTKHDLDVCPHITKSAENAMGGQIKWLKEFIVYTAYPLPSKSITMSRTAPTFRCSAKPAVNSRARWAGTIVGEEQETGVSGYKVSANDRDKLQLIKERAEQGKFDILLVFMFDRLGRKSDETPFVVEWFCKKGIKVWSVNEGEQRFESHTDRLTNYIRFWQADGESQKTSIRTKTALGQMMQEGWFRGGKAPFGYRLEKSGILNKRKHEVNKLVIDEEEAEVVRTMFDLCVSSGFGRWRMANFLNDHGIKNRKGENWYDATICAIRCIKASCAAGKRIPSRSRNCRLSRRKPSTWHRS